MLTTSLKALFERDLSKLITEIKSYREEANIWKTDKAILNSAGNLCLHLAGNLNTFIGATLGHTNYIRNRELEFSQKNIPPTELVEKIEQLKVVVSATLDKLTDDDLQMEYAVVVFDKPMTTAYFLVHLVTHLAYHLGQINYHRRLLDAD